MDMIKLVCIPIQKVPFDTDENVIKNIEKYRAKYIYPLQATMLSSLLYPAFGKCYYNFYT